MKQVLKDFVAKIRSGIAKHPLKVVGVTAAVSFVVGVLVG